MLSHASVVHHVYTHSVTVVHKTQVSSKNICLLLCICFGFSYVAFTSESIDFSHFK